MNASVAVAVEAYHAGAYHADAVGRQFDQEVQLPIAYSFAQNLCPLIYQHWHLPNLLAASVELAWAVPAALFAVALDLASWLQQLMPDCSRSRQVVVLESGIDSLQPLVPACRVDAAALAPTIFLLFLHPCLIY